MLNKTFNMKPTNDMNEDHTDFMQPYNLRHKQQSTITTNQREANAEITNLKWLSKNIGASRRKDSNLTHR